MLNARGRVTGIADASGAATVTVDAVTGMDACHNVVFEV
jgi:hypothetical protein